MFTEFTQNESEKDRPVVESVVFITFLIYRVDICMFPVHWDFAWIDGFLKYEFDGWCDVST